MGYPVLCKACGAVHDPMLVRCPPAAATQSKTVVTRSIEPGPCASCEALRGEIEALKAELKTAKTQNQSIPKQTIDRKAYMREYMRKRRCSS